MDFFLTQERFQQGKTWQEYLENSPTTRSMQQKRYAEDPPEDIQQYFQTLHFTGNALILSESQCGDCAWSVPRIMRLLDEAAISTRFFQKALNPDLMEMLPTNGKMSVPKVAFLDDNMNLIGTWGPRPAKIQKFVEENAGKTDRGIWYPKVLKYYRTEGLSDLYYELRLIFERMR